MICGFTRSSKAVAVGARTARRHAGGKGGLRVALLARLAATADVAGLDPTVLGTTAGATLSGTQALRAYGDRAALIDLSG